MAKFRALDTAPEIFTAPVITTSVSKGDPLKFGAGGVELAGDGDRVDAFAAAAGNVGDYVTCYRGAMRLVGLAATGVNFGLGDQVYLDASQKLDTGTTGDTSLGEVAGFDPDSGGMVEFRFDPLGSVQHG